ncbi:MAG: hypothetical protein AB7O73_00645 [Bacteroidia bacterium]
MREKIDTPYYAMYLKGGIIHQIYKPELIITLEIAKQMVTHRLEITKRITRPVFVDVRNLVAIDAASRKYLAGEMAVKYVSAGAIFLDNYLHYLAGTVYIKIDRPAVPSKLFTDKEKALLWLEPFKHLN